MKNTNMKHYHYLISLYLIYKYKNHSINNLWNYIYKFYRKD